MSDDDLTRPSGLAPPPALLRDDVLRDGPAFERGKALGPYVIETTIGIGGMGEVFRAKDMRLGRRVAVKVLPRRVAGSAARRLRFNREAKMMCQVTHPNVCHLYDVGSADGMPYLVMEYVEGETVAERLEGGPIPIEEVFDVGVQVAEAIAAAHAKGIVHRDLKPSNLMITANGIKVLDFGIAGWSQGPDTATVLDEDSGSDRLTRVGALIGTPRYMSPEQVEGHPVDHRADIFALGLVLYEMATGEHAFSAKSRELLMQRIVKDEAPALSRVGSSAAPDLDRIVRRCLEKDPESRYASATALAADLRAARRQRAQQQGLWRNATLWQRVGLVAAGVGLLALAGLAVFQRGSGGGSAYRTLAVLPFVEPAGVSPEEATDSDAHLGDTLASALVRQLSSAPSLEVVSQSQLGGSASRQQVRRLGVDLVLEGELSRRGDALSAAISLSEVEQGVVLWSSSFDGRTDDLLDLQLRIASSVAEYLELSRQERRQFERRPTESRTAYNVYLKGQDRLRFAKEPMDLDIAIELFRQAVRGDERFALAYAGLSEALWTRYQRSRRLDDLEEAERMARRSIELDADLPAGRVALALVLRSTGKVEDSIAELQAGLADHAKPAEVYRELALSYERLGEIDEAEKFTRLATDLDDRDWLNWNRLGTFYLRVGRYDKAEDAFKRAAGLTTASEHRPRENIATLAMLRGRFEKAIEAYEAIPGPIQSATMATNLATAYYFSARADKWAQAERYYKLAVELSPDRHDIRRNLADLYATLGRVEEGQEQYRKALEMARLELDLDPGNLDLRQETALYAAKSGDCAPALIEIGRPESRTSEKSEFLHIRAQVLALCGEKDQALAALRIALEHGVVRGFIRQDPEFVSLRGDPEFEALVADPK